MKAILATAALAAALVPSPGHAAILAQCTGSAPSSGTLTGVCYASLTATGLTPVTMTVEPGPLFAGTLQAALRKDNAPIGIGFNGLFVGPIPVLGTASATFNIDAGEWTLEVYAGGLPPCIGQPSPPPVMHCSRPLLAVGDFAGSVSTP